MKFSIVIPVYKTEHLLKRCLDSFAAQTDGDFEVIVVDDCSPGVAARPEFAPYPNAVGADLRAASTQAREIVAQYDARFKFVRHEKNLSLFQARQTGLRMAQGEYVIPFDSDDYALPKLLEKLRVAISPVGAASCRTQEDQSSSVHFHFSPSPSSPDVIVYQMMYDDGKTITKPSVRYKDEFLSGPEALDRFFASKIQCAICGKAVRREVYLKAMDQLAVPRDFYLNSSEDLCQTFPVLLNAETVATISYPGYRYWLNGDSLTTTLTDPAKLGKAAENTARVFDMLAGFVRRTPCAGQDGYVEHMLARLDGFMRPTLRWYLSCLRHLPETEWRACVAELNRHFSPDLVAREAMLLVEESKTYRLGKMLVSAMRILRRGR